MKNPKSILITGASSGLGAALAQAYANDGITLFLTGRNQDRLANIAQLCTNKGAKVNIKAMDIKDHVEVEQWIKSSDQQTNIDLIIANAGISAGTAGGGENIEQVTNIFDTNTDAAITTIHSILPEMKERQKGQIVLISSLAAFRGLPSSPAYSASKAAIKTYGEGLRGILQKDNIEVTVVTPGYIKTPMTSVNNFPMPFLIEAEKAAKLIKNKLTKNPARIAFPFPLYSLIWLLSSLPPSITDPIFSRLPGKPNINSQGTL